MRVLQIKAIEDNSREGCEQQANAFLVTIPMIDVADVVYGSHPVSSPGVVKYYCYIVFKITI